MGSENGGCGEEGPSSGRISQAAKEAGTQLSLKHLLKSVTKALDSVCTLWLAKAEIFVPSAA